MDYEEEMAKIVKEVKRLAFECDEWTLRKSTAKVKVESTPVPYSRNPAFRVETVIDAQPRRLFDMVYPFGPYRQKFDPFIEVCELLHPVSKEIKVCYQVVKPQLRGLIKSRDTVDLFQMQTTKEYRSCIFSSIHYDEPVVHRKPGYIPGWNYPCGIFFIPTNNIDQTKIVFVLSVDLTLHAMNINFSVPLFILEHVLIKKMLLYLTCMDNNRNIPWKPLEYTS